MSRYYIDYGKICKYVVKVFYNEDFVIFIVGFNLFVGLSIKKVVDFCFKFWIISGNGVNF